MASPALTGNPTAPTQAPGDNSTKLATTAYADNAGGGGFSSGQTWTGNLWGATRFNNTNYQNTTGYPILVHVSLFDGGGTTDHLVVGPSNPATISVSSVDSATPGDGDDTLSAIIPPNWWYRVNINSAGGVTMYELR